MRVCADLRGEDTVANVHVSILRCGVVIGARSASPYLPPFENHAANLRRQRLPFFNPNILKQQRVGCTRCKRKVDQNPKYIHTQCVHGIFGRNITKYTVIYGVYIRLWPML